MQTSSPVQPSSPKPLAAAEMPRQLNDEVLQSAEEAVLVDAAAPGVGAFPLDPAPHEQRARLAGPAIGSRYSYQNTVKQYVATSPFQSAWLAAAAGALLTVLVRAKWRKRLQTRSQARMR